MYRFRKVGERVQRLTDQSKPLAFSALGRFYLPLAFTSFIMASSHWVISVGLARMARPEIALASYAVGMSTLSLFEMPAVMLRATSLALVHTRSDARVVLRTGLVILGALVGIPAVLSFTPALTWIYRSVLGVSPTVLQPAATVFRILLLLPLASGLRCFFQGLIIQERRTGFVTLGMVVRLCVMAATIITLVHLRPHWGGAVGAITFLLGMWTEAAMALWRGRKTQVMRSVRTGSPCAQPVAVRTVLTFLLPLLATGMVSNSGRMLLNAGLAREVVAPGVLASFTVGWSLAWVLAAMVWGLHQTVLVFAGDGRLGALLTIRRFFRTVAAGSAILIALLSFTPLSGLVLRGVMGTPETLVPGAAQAMRWLVLLPVVLAWQEWNTGNLMARRCTQVLFWGKLTNVMLVAFAAGPGYPVLKGLGAAVGSVATLLGHAGEGTVLTVASWLQRRRTVRDTERRAEVA